MVYTDGAEVLFDAAGLYDLDDGFVPVDDGEGVVEFVERCREPRYWPRLMVSA